METILKMFISQLRIFLKLYQDERTFLMAGLNYKEAEEIAITAFKEHFVNRNIPDEIANRLSVGASVESDQWEFSISLLPKDISSKGLETDLINFPLELMVTVLVNRVTGLVNLIEEPSIQW